jgi:cell division septation protein DedD
VPGAAVQFERIARLFNLAGRIEEARGAYLAAHSEGAPDSTLVSAFLLSLQMNDAEMMSASLAQMSGTGETAFLRALWDARAGDSTAARAALVGLADQTGNPELALKALWILYEAARSSGDSEGQGTLRAKLTRRFGPSPETALAAGPFPGGAAPRATVVQMPAPDPLEIRQSLPAVSAPPAASENTLSGAPGLPSSPLMAVQAGSFLMKENADDLVSELNKRGFSPVVVHETAQGKDRYRVLAGTGLELEAAKIMLKRLSDAGYRGFLIQMKERP